MKSSRGFTLIEGMLLLLVLAGLSFAGWTVHQRQADKADPATAAVQKISSTPLKTTSDLDVATKALDETPIDNSSETAQLDKDLANF